MNIPEIILSGLLLGVGFAMDAFSVSLANGLNEPKMPVRRALGIAAIFSIFQGIMPFIGWFCVTNVKRFFDGFTNVIPFIALGLLGYIGGKMLYEGIKEYKCKSGGGTDCPVPQRLTITALLLQGVATSIDALSGGLDMEGYVLLEAVLCALIIAVLTFGICFAGIQIGKKSGTVLSSKAAIFGGSILIFIGLEIFVTWVFETFIIK